MKKRILLSLAAISVLSQASAITITKNRVTSSIFDYPSWYIDEYTGTTLLTSKTLNVSSSGISSQTQINYTESGGIVTFSNALTHARTGALYCSTGSSGHLEFTVDTKTQYEASGYYNVDNTSDVEAYTHLRSWMWQGGDEGPRLFKAEQRSTNSFDENFVLGESAGEYNTNTGSLTGTLFPGTLYGWNFDAGTSRSEEEDSGATGEGNVTLTLTPLTETGPPSIPDGGTTAALLGLSLLSLAAVRRRLVG